MTEKVAVVTGARRGIGLGIAKRFRQEGYQVLLAAASPESAAEELVGQLNEQYGREESRPALYLQCDISLEEDRKNLFAFVQEHYGRMDALVNNAGVAPNVRLDLLDTTPGSFERLVRINLEGTFFMCQGGANLMLRQLREGLEDFRPRIVNISSMSAYTSSTNRGEYCVTKAGISMVTQLFADRLAEAGIGVFEVRPGIIATDMTEKVHEKYAKLIEEGVTPIRRFGRPEDVADCVWAAAGGLLDFATGQVLNADGGFHIRRL